MPAPPFIRRAPIGAEQRVHIKPQDGYSGFVVYMSSDGKNLVRAFQVYAEALPSGIVFTPSFANTVVIDVAGGFELPPDRDLTTLLPSKPLDSANAAPELIRTRPTRSRAHAPITVQSSDGSLGAIVFLNLGSDGNRQTLVRTLDIYKGALSRGITFTPPADGMLIVDVVGGAVLPGADNQELNALVMNASAAAGYANSPPGSQRRKPPYQ